MSIYISRCLPWNYLHTPVVLFQYQIEKSVTHTKKKKKNHRPPCLFIHSFVFQYLGEQVSLLALTNRPQTAGSAYFLVSVYQGGRWKFCAILKGKSKIYIFRCFPVILKSKHFLRQIGHVNTEQGKVSK